MEMEEMGEMKNNIPLSPSFISLSPKILLTLCLHAY